MPLGVGPRYAVHGRSELHVLGSARTKDQKGGGVRGRLSGTSTTELGDGRSRRLVVAAEVACEGGENGAVDEAARVGLESERKGLLGDFPGAALKSCCCGNDASSPGLDTRGIKGSSTSY